jgi:hypothetical protein
MDTSKRRHSSDTHRAYTRTQQEARGLVWVKGRRREERICGIQPSGVSLGVRVILKGQGEGCVCVFWCTFSCVAALPISSSSC